ncbi:hypothetical protein KQI18_12035 [Clostridioides mangenotii]|uniref:hypothetical protein n=1 Tax=Metaclostridioides mangenotii TaxID=1540 RepID=UPI001C122F0B|nr:hypothetical protein [Clostridioides mangenotii]MBU5308506.1 hypothetical protein [Clostridioides mangenotii]
MDILFTKGICGELKNGKIHLLSSYQDIATDYEYKANDLIKLESEYKIRLLGCKHKASNGYEFQIIHKRDIIDVKSLLYKIESKFITLYDRIENIIYTDNYETLRYLRPIFLNSGGISSDCFISQKKFQELYLYENECGTISNEGINRILYCSDLNSIVSSMQEFVNMSYIYLIDANVRTNELLVNNIIKNKEILVFEDQKNENYFENRYYSHETRYIISMYMNTIIQICSTLDLVSKLTCEIVNFPSDFSKIIKFKSGNLYFNNIKRYKEKLSSYHKYESSFIINHKFYNDLILARNKIVHNSFLLDQSFIFYGYNTHVVNYKPIEYMLAYIWDVDEEGNPENWKNRYRFYSQEREIGEYLLNNLIEFYINMDSTLSLLIDYLEINLTQEK